MSSTSLGSAFSLRGKVAVRDRASGGIGGAISNSSRRPARGSRAST